MKRMMKSKILATALCSTVMAGIYASPVMAEKLYYGEVGINRTLCQGHF